MSGREMRRKIGRPNIYSLRRSKQLIAGVSTCVGNEGRKSDDYNER
jgi:hypothetical protein